MKAREWVLLGLIGLAASIGVVLESVGAAVPELLEQAAAEHEAEVAARDARILELTMTLSRAEQDRDAAAGKIEQLEADLRAALEKLAALESPAVLVEDVLPPLPAGAREYRVPDDVATVSAALKLVQDGRGDRVLLRRGQVHDSGGAWITAGGGGEASPFVLGAYGEGPRPVLKLSGTLTISGANSTYLKSVWLVGVDVYKATADPRSAEFVKRDSSGVRAIRVASDLRLIGCRLRFCGFSAVNTGAGAPRMNGVRLIDTHIADAYTASTHSEGVYMSQVDDALFENVAIERCGWDGVDPLTRTVFDQGIYLHDSCGRVVVRGLLVVDNAASGALFCAGENDVDGVISIGNSTGVNLGRHGSKYRAGGVVVRARRVFISDTALLASSGGKGMDVGNLRAGSSVEGVIAYDWLAVSGSEADGQGGCHAAWRDIDAPALTWYGPDMGFTGASLRDARLGAMKWRDGPTASPPAIAVDNVTVGAARRTAPAERRALVAEATSRWGEPGHGFEALWAKLTE